MNTPPKTLFWKPLSPETLAAIRGIFSALFPTDETGDLADRIADYWINRLRAVWAQKPEALREKDLSFRPDDPLSRLCQKTVVIAYADSIFAEGEKTLDTLGRFLARHFPAVGGLHILPACEIAGDRFNDGYFSQIRRDRVHPAFGTNARFAELSKTYFSMADFVLNHVDMENPAFQAYLNGDDNAGACFYVFSEREYQTRKARGDFDQIFRPRPFPLFTIFRRKPADPESAALDPPGKIAAMARRLLPDRVPVPVIGLMSVFGKIKNDQMLLADDYELIVNFIQYLNQEARIPPENLFLISSTQETRHIPYVFAPAIRTKNDLLAALGFAPETARRLAARYDENDAAVFGPPVRVLTTFSHVQVDVNTSTFAGLKLLADDFSWYLSLDLNMLRLDAANYAFKRWGTSCFGLPEVKKLMQILYLSMDAVAPRMAANLEVNDRLSAILAQMADPENPPPMMYDFHLASLLPAVFNMQNADIAARIFDLVRAYDIPQTSIRFSVAETHDGKSVRGSLDLLTPSERQGLARIVEANGGRIKFSGAEPYELCVSTRDALVRLDDPARAADRFLAFYTLGFALMGRNIKSIYFNDLLGLGNDYARLKQTGEFRDIKRTRSRLAEIEGRLADANTFESNIARGLNQLIAVVDADPALNFRGHEARTVRTGNPAVAAIFNHHGKAATLTIVSTSPQKESVAVDAAALFATPTQILSDRFTRRSVPIIGGYLKMDLAPFERWWLKNTPFDSRE